MRAYAFLLATSVTALHPVAPALPARAAVRPAAALVQTARAPPPAMFEIDFSYVIGIGALVVGLGGGVALIAFTENAGKKNEERSNQQPCVECKSAQVVQCTICRGSGEDALAQYVAGVREMAGETDGDSSVSTVTVDDWESGPKSVEMYGEILKAYPPKATANLCQ